VSSKCVPCPLEARVAKPPARFGRELRPSTWPRTSIRVLCRRSVRPWAAEGGLRRATWRRSPWEAGPTRLFERSAQVRRALWTKLPRPTRWSRPGRSRRRSWGCPKPCARPSSCRGRAQSWAAAEGEQLARYDQWPSPGLLGARGWTGRCSEPRDDWDQSMRWSEPRGDLAREPRLVPQDDCVHSAGRRSEPRDDRVPRRAGRSEPRDDCVHSAGRRSEPRDDCVPRRAGRSEPRDDCVHSAGREARGEAEAVLAAKGRRGGRGPFAGATAGRSAGDR
jgi:hypothetical protein